MAEQEVKAFDRFGAPITLPASAVPELEKMGGRVATEAEIREASRATAEKVGGAVGTAIGAATAPLTWTADALAPAARAAVASQLSAEQQALLAQQQGKGFAGALMQAREAAGSSFFNQATGGLGEGVMRAGLGAVDPGAGADYQRQIEQQRTDDGAARALGGAGGFLGNALASGGLGSGATSTAAKLAPGQLATTIGGLTESSISRLGVAALERGGAGARALGQAVTMGARGAAEGAVMGAQEYVGDQLLKDQALAADQLYAAMGHGALFGAGGGATVGGALSLGGSAVAATARGIGRLVEGTGKVAAEGAGFLQKGTSTAERGLAGLAKGEVPTVSDVQKFAARAFGVDEASAKGVAEQVVEYYSKASAAAAGQDAGQIRKLLALTPEGKAARKVAVYEADKIQDAAARAIRTHGDEMLRASRDVTEEAIGGLKASHVAKSVQRGNEDATRAFANAYADDVLAKVDAAMQQRVAPQMVKSLETASTLAYQIKEAAAKGADNAGLFVALDNAKRSMQRLAATGNRSVRNIVDPLEQIAARDALKIFEDVAEGARQGLQDTSLWGKAAEQQIAINAAWTRQIDASNRFHKALTTEVGRDPLNPYVQMLGVDPAKASSYVKNLTNVDRDLTHTAVRDYLQSTQDVTKAIRAAYDLPAEKLAQVAKVEQSAKAFQKSLGEAENALVLSNQFRELTRGDKASMLGTIGGVVGGLPGGALGVVGDALNAPGKTIARMAAVERLLEKVDAATSAGARGLVSPKVEGAVRGAAEKGRKVAESAQKQAAKAVERIAEARANIEAFSERVSKQAAAVGATAPKTAAMYAERLTRGATFLASKMPETMQNNALTPGQKPQMTEGEAARFMRYVRAVENPMSVLEDAKRGTVSREAIEALRETSPRLYQELRQRTMDVLASHVAAGKPLPYSRRLSLSVMFDIPGDRSLEPAAFKALQANTAPAQQPAEQQQRAPQARGPQRPLTLDVSSHSPWDRIERGRAGRR